MALRNQPYLPLYVRDFSADEKLRNCSAESVGIYIMIMCFLHVTPTYGAITLQERQKKTTSNIENFAWVLLRQLPFDLEEIIRGLTQLIDEEVLTLDGDTLYQKRMVKDGEISEKRAMSGALGGLSRKNGEKKSKANQKQTKSKSKANQKQITENEIEYEYETENDNDNEDDIGENKKKGIARKKTNEDFLPPTREEVRVYATERNAVVDPDVFFDYFNEGNWVDSLGKPVKSWKQKFITWDKAEKEKQSRNVNSGGKRINTPEKKPEEYKGRSFIDDLEEDDG